MPRAHALRVALLLPTLILLLPGRAPAAEAVLLDLSLPTCWEIEQWSKAPGTLSTGQEKPADVPLPDALLTPLAVSIDWPGGGDFRFFSVLPKGQATRIPYRLASIRLWVKSSGDGHAMELGFRDADGKDQKVGLGTLTEAGWHEVRADIPQEWKQPLEVRSITWHNWGMQTGGPATTLLCGLLGTVDTAQKLVEGDVAPRLLASPEDPNGIAFTGDENPVQVRVLGWEPLSAGALRLTEMLDLGAQPRETVTALDTGGSSAYGGATRPKSDRNGCFTMSLTLDEAAGAKVVARQEVRLAWVTRPWNVNGGQRLASPIGVNTHVGAPWHAFGRLGIHWARDYSWTWLGHGDTAPEGNGRDFSKVLAEAEANGVIVLPVTQGAFRNSEGTGYSSDSGMLATAFAKLSRAFPTIPFWEPDNEYDLALSTRWYPPGNYENALQAMAQGLSDAGRAKVVLTGTAGIRYEETVDLLHSSAASSFAAVNSHFYTGTAGPEEGISDTNLGGAERYRPLSGIEQLSRVSSAAHRKGKYSWLTEIGWDVIYGPAVTEDEQCMYLVRAYLLARQAGADKVFWFYDRDIPNATGKFASSGLLRLDGSVRPSGVALAQLSRETAHAELQGELDLGGDSRALVFTLPDGGVTIAAWSPAGGAALPESLSTWAASDQLGNPTDSRELDASVRYLHGWTLPAPLAKQVATRWATGTVVTAAPGEEVDLSVEMPSGALTWGDLPSGVTATDWRSETGVRTTTLRAAPEVEQGVYRFLALASGDGWGKRLPLTLSVEPALRVEAGPYVPGQAQLVTVSTTERPQRVTIAGGEGATVAPTDFTVAPGRSQRVALAPDAHSRTPISLSFRTGRGAVQDLAVPCILWPVAGLAAPQLDGAVAEWPEALWLPETSLGLSAWAPAGPRLALARSDAGLALALSVPAKEMQSGKATDFWESTNIEVFADPTGGTGMWSRACRQVFLLPIRSDDGSWRVETGLWDRSGGGGQPAPGVAAAASVRDGRLCLEAVIPWELLGREPKAGSDWRLAIAGQFVDGATAWDLGWPSRKSGGLLAGPSGWGIARFP